MLAGARWMWMVAALAACGGPQGSGPCPDGSQRQDYYPDLDGDGFGDEAQKTASCSVVEHYIQKGGDCDDLDPLINPDGREVCDPEDKDEDCDGLVGNDDALGAGGAVTGYPDGDGDGFGDANGAQQPTCTFGYGTVENNTDCDDTDPFTFPGAAEFDDPLACLQDKDDDGFGEMEPTNGAVPGTDCKDNDSATFPGAPEILVDGGDQDCDGYDAFGLFDDFEIGFPDPAVWAQITGNYSITQDYVSSGSFALTLSGDTALAETRTVDTSHCTDLSWWLEGKRGPDAPSSSSYVYVDYWDGTRWVQLDEWQGGADGSFIRRGGPILDYAAQNPDFKLRLDRSGGSIGYDDFHIDDFFVGCPGADGDGDGYPFQFDCNDFDAAHWSDCGLCNDVDSDDYGTNCDLGDDCDDADGSVHPGAADPRGDGIDTNCDGTDGVQFFDDFDTGSFKSTVWASISGDFEIQTGYASSGAYALNLGGGVGVAETLPMDTSTCPGVFWSFMGKRGPELPDSGDNLRLDYWDGTSWVQADLWLGGTTDSAFALRQGEISGPTAQHPAFAVRLTTNGSGTGLDDFFIDDFRLGCADDVDGDGVVDPLDCDPSDANHWADCGSCTDGDGDGHGTGCDLGYDCDDANPALSPAATEVAGNGVDEDCDGYDRVALADGFELGNPRPQVWDQVSGDVSVQGTEVLTGSFALEVGALDGMLQSQTMRTTGCPDVWYSMDVKRSGSPAVGDDLVLSYDNGTGWQTIARVQGEGRSDGEFYAWRGTIGNPGALWSDFRVRLQATGGGGGVGSFLVDDFVVTCGVDADTDGTPAFEDCNDADGAHWSDCGLCVDADGDAFGFACDFGPDCDDADPLTYPGAPDPIGDALDTNCDGIDGTALHDDFELGVIDPAVFVSLTGDGAIQSTYISEGSYAMNLGGGGAEAVTVPMDTSSCDAIRFSWQGKRGPELPDNGDNVTVEYLTATGWVTTYTWLGGTTDPDFGEIFGLVTSPDALWSGFTLRLTSNGSGTGTDDFFLDEFDLRCFQDDDGDGIGAGEDCDDTDPAHWYDCGVCVDGDGDDFGAACDLGGDCDDTDAAIHPGAPDPDGDGIDMNCDGSDGVLLVDDFELGAVDPAVFAAVAGQADVQTAYVWDGTYALNLYGSSGVVETVTFDTSTCSSLIWGYMGKRGPDQPESTDPLNVEYWDGAGWVLVDQWFGASVVDTDFTRRWGQITTAGAFHGAFKLRMTTTAGSSYADDFFVDDFVLGCADATDTDLDGSIDVFDCALTDPLHWSDCGNCLDGDGDAFGVDCDLGEDCDDYDAAVNPDAVDMGLNGLDENCDAIDGLPLFFDDFELGVADPAVWLSVTGDAMISPTEVYQGAYAQNIGGGTGEMVSLPVDASACTAVAYSFWAQQGPEQPDLGDDLDLSYDGGTGMVLSQSWVGGNTSGVFRYHSGVITDPGALTTTLTIDVFTAGSGSGFDDWYIDDFAVGCAP